MVAFEQKEHYGFEDFRRLVAVLRGPGGCPWDAAQDHHSIRRNLLEEAYELAQALDREDLENMKEELGDVLLQVLFHARLEEEQGRFSIDEVCDAAVKKLIFRHPHVFGDMAGATPEEALRNWDAKKRVEKRQRSVAQAMADVAETLPALWRADKLLQKAEKAGLAPEDAQQARETLKTETARLCAAKAEEAEAALGQTLLAAVRLGRSHGADPERALHRACERYVEEIRAVEAANSTEA